MNNKLCFKDQTYKKNKISYKSFSYVLGNETFWLQD